MTEPSEKLFTRTFAIAFSAGLLLAFNFSCNAVYPLYVRHEGGSAETIGLFMGILFFSALAVRPLIGMMIDRWGAKPVLLLSALCMGLPSLGFMHYTDQGIVPAVWALRIIQGFGFGGHFTAYFLFAAETAPASRRSETVGKYGIAGLFGGMIAPPIAERIIMPSGDGSVTKETLSVFFIAMAILGILGFLLMLQLPSPKPQQGGKLPSPSGLLKTLKSGRMRLVFSIALLFAIAFSAASSFLAPIASERDIHGFGLYFTGFGITAIFVRAFSARWGDRIGLRRVLIPCFFLYSAGLMVLHFSTSTEWVIFAGVINGVAHGIAFPIVTTLGYSLAPEGYAGSSMALVTGMMDGGTALSAFALGQAAEWWSYDIIFPASAMATILAILLLLRDVLTRPKPIKSSRISR